MRPTGSDNDRGGSPVPRRKVFKCGITPTDTTSISRPSKGWRFFNPLMSGLCLECLGDRTRRVVSAATLIKFLATDPDYLETESSTIRPYSGRSILIKVYKNVLHILVKSRIPSARVSGFFQPPIYDISIFFFVGFPLARSIEYWSSLLVHILIRLEIIASSGSPPLSNSRIS